MKPSKSSVKALERNIVVRTEHLREQDADFLFGPLPEGEIIEFFDPGEATWAAILVEQGIFSSKSQARKAGFHEFPSGWTDRSVGKAKRTRFCIWNPSQ